MTDTLVVDLCGTLVRENTTHGFVRAASLRTPMGIAARLLLSRPGFGSTRLIGNHAHRRLVVACLRGTSHAQLRGDAAAYAETTLRSNARASVLEKIRLARALGTRVVLASASLDVIVEAFCRAVHADGWIASRLAYDASDTCLGLLADDATGRKLALLERQWGALGRFSVVTDNPEDTDLMAAASETQFIRGPHD